MRSRDRVAFRTGIDTLTYEHGFFDRLRETVWYLQEVASVPYFSHAESPSSGSSISENAVKDCIMRLEQVEQTLNGDPSAAAELAGVFGKFP